MTTTARKQTRVVLIEDHTLFAESMELALSVEGYDVRRAEPEKADTPSTLTTSVTRLKPRIVLLDLDLGRFGDGGRLITSFARRGINVVVVTGSVDRARWGEAIHAGARTVVSKSSPLSGILATVRRLSQGLPVMTHTEREELVRTWIQAREHHEDVRSRLDSLTRRESQILGHMLDGQSVSEIARADVVSEATVRTQVKSILAKLGVNSQIAAVGQVHQVGWRPPV